VGCTTQQFSTVCFAPDGEKQPVESAPPHDPFPLCTEMHLLKCAFWFGTFCKCWCFVMPCCRQQLPPAVGAAYNVVSSFS
jgi:hypothetical protein